MACIVHTGEFKTSGDALTEFYILVPQQLTAPQPSVSPSRPAALKIQVRHGADALC